MKCSMKRSMRRCPALLVVLALCATAQQQDAGVQQQEALRYSVNWPSGLALGEAALSANGTAAGWEFEMTLDAGIPGFRIADRFHSVTNAAGCSLEFTRETSHGSRKSSEKTTFDYAAGVAHRVSLNGGGESTLPLPTHCAFDALAFLFAMRRELARGVVLGPTEIFFGSPYSVRLDRAGDRLIVHLKGPASSSDFEIQFAQDGARTPLQARIPTSVGAISVELSR